MGFERELIFDFRPNGVKIYGTSKKQVGESIKVSCVPLAWRTRDFKIKCNTSVVKVQ